MSGPIIEITIDVSDLICLAQALPQMESIIYQEMKKAMEESGMLLTSLVEARTPVNYGILRSSIQWPSGFELKNDTLDLLRGIVGASDIQSATGISANMYVDFVEEDTSPHWAPIAPLKLYAIRKWGDEKAAYGLQVKIARSGTKGKHMFKQGWEAGKDKVEAIWQRVPVRAVDILERIAQ
jgi:hypothetical protein